MKQSVSFDAVQDHIVLRFDEGCRVLLDTGSPQSFGRAVFTLLGEDLDLRSQPTLMDMDMLAGRLGSPLDGLLGMDHLAEVRVLIEWCRRTVTFSSSPLDVVGRRDPLAFVMGIPVVALEVGAGTAARAFLDTGATVSYLDDEAPRNELLGTVQDFLPGMAGLSDFETAIHSGSVVLGGRPLSIRFGALPPMMATLLSLASVTNILGSDVWKTWDVLFDFPGGSVTFIDQP